MGNGALGGGSGAVGREGTGSRALGRKGTGSGALGGEGTGNGALGGEGTRKVRWETRVGQNDLTCSTVATQVFSLLVYSIM